MTKRQLFKLLDNPKTPDSEIAGYGPEFVTAASDFIIQDRFPSCMVGCAGICFGTIALILMGLMDYVSGSSNSTAVALLMVTCAIVAATAIFMVNSSYTQRRILTARAWLAHANNLEIATAIRVLTIETTNTSEQYDVTMKTMARLREILQGQTGNDLHRIPVAERNRLRSLIMVNDSELHASMNIEILRILGEARDRFARDNIEALAKNPARNQYEQAVKEMAGWVMVTYFNYPVDQHPAEMLMRASTSADGHLNLLRPAGSVETDHEILLRSVEGEQEL